MKGCVEACPTRRGDADGGFQCSDCDTDLCNSELTDVKSSGVDLLCRVALQSSHLIVYPVVVATMQSDPRANSGLGISLEEQEDIEEEAENEKNKQEELSAPEGKSVKSEVFLPILITYSQ